MSETNNVSKESSDDSSIRFINRKSGPRRRLSFSSDSSDCNSTNPTNTLIGRKRSRNPVKFKCDYNEDTEFQAINIRKSLVGRPQSLKNIDQPLLYPKGRTVTREKWRDMMDLLKFIPPVNHDYYKSLSTNRKDESSHTADEEDIIYNIAESSQRIMPLT